MTAETAGRIDLEAGVENGEKDENTSPEAAAAENTSTMQNERTEVKEPVASETQTEIVTEEKASPGGFVENLVRSIVIFVAVVVLVYLITMHFKPTTENVFSTVAISVLVLAIFLSVVLSALYCRRRHLNYLCPWIQGRRLGMISWNRQAEAATFQKMDDQSEQRDVENQITKDVTEMANGGTSNGKAGQSQNVELDSDEKTPILGSTTGETSAAAKISEVAMAVSAIVSDSGPLDKQNLLQSSRSSESRVSDLDQKMEPELESSGEIRKRNLQNPEAGVSSGETQK